MPTTFIDAFAQAGLIGLVLGFFLWQGNRIIERIMNESRAREDRLVSERQRAEAELKEARTTFLATLDEICHGVREKVEQVDKKVEGLQSDVETVKTDVKIMIGASSRKVEVV